MYGNENTLANTLAPAGGLEKPSPISNELNASHKLLAVLHETIGRAEHELSKILRPHGEGKSGNEGVNPRPTLSPTLMTIQDLNQGIQEAVNRIEVILARSEG